jgi:hypothetical protein
VKVIRAKKALFVPLNPERPDKNAMRLVSAGLVALVPEEFFLPDGSYQDVGHIKTKDNKKD